MVEYILEYIIVGPCKFGTYMHDLQTKIQMIRRSDFTTDSWLKLQIHDRNNNNNTGKLSNPNLEIRTIYNFLGLTMN